MDCHVTNQELLPGVYQLTDRMGMHMTLLTGSEKALLIDTGYGLDDLQKAVGEITALPLTVVCTHGHHDHACGNFQFDQVYLLKKEIPVCRAYAGSWRERVWSQAQGKGLNLADWQKEAFIDAGCGNLISIPGGDWDLGGLTARLIPSPGHTPGSMVIYVPERRLVITGDNWNPTTWLFFPEAEGMAIFRASFDAMLALDFDFAICSHGEGLFPKQDLMDFRQGITAECLRQGSVPTPELWPGKHVMTCHPAGRFTFCYDAEKLPPEEQ